jgi:hypothetical protein
MYVAGTEGGVFIQYLLSIFLNCVVNVQCVEVTIELTL